MMDGLVEFATARLAEDRCAMDRLLEQPVTPDNGDTWAIPEETDPVLWVYRWEHTIGRMRRQHTANATILALHGGSHVCKSLNGHGVTDYATDEDGLDPCPTIRAAVAVWADHPDYNPEWSTPA